MTFKKILLLSAAGVATVTMISATACCHLPDPLSPVALKVADHHFYLEANAGYARQNYFSNTNWDAPLAGQGEGTNFSNGTDVHGGFSAGFDTGYVLNQYFSAELGWFHLPSVNVMQQGTAPAYLKSWAWYLAAKYMMPLSWMHNTDAFFKLGAEYRTATLDAGARAAAGGYNTSASRSIYIRPVFGTGLDYHFSNCWVGIVQYMYFMGANNSFPLITPNTGALGTIGANVFTLGLGYQFVS